MDRPNRKIYWNIWNKNNPNDKIFKNSCYMIHHIDGNPFNNDINNLQKKMKREEHNVVHFKDKPVPKISELKTGLRLSYETKMKISKIKKERYSGENHPLYGIKRDDVIGDNNPMANPAIREKQKINSGIAQRKRRLKEKINKMNLLLIFDNLQIKGGF